jgi:uncharacterized protein YciI
MYLYCCYSLFNLNLIDKINEIRDVHLLYIKNNIENIIYGGVVNQDNQDYKGILMIIKANNINEAENFIKNDPYFELYKTSDINLFSQRILKI